VNVEDAFVPAGSGVGVAADRKVVATVAYYIFRCSGSQTHTYFSFEEVLVAPSVDWVG
jgi:hypothetical protein